VRRRANQAAAWLAPGRQIFFWSFEMSDKSKSDDRSKEYKVPIVESARDQRVLDYLVAKVGVEVVLDAAKKLPGGRKPYVSNLARMLKVVIPDSVHATSREDGRAKLQEIKKFLGDRKKAR
jgi:hypothetical protein